MNADWLIKRRIACEPMYPSSEARFLSVESYVQHTENEIERLRAELSAVKLQIGIGARGDVVAASGRAMQVAITEMRKAVAERDALRELLQEWDSLIQHQYSGTREAMSAMTAVAQRTAAALAAKGRG